MPQANQDQAQRLGKSRESSSIEQFLMSKSRDMAPACLQSNSQTGLLETTALVNHLYASKMENSGQAPVMFDKLPIYERETQMLPS